MGVKPAEQADSQTLCGQDAYWSAICKVGKMGIFNVSDIDGMCNTHRATVWGYMRRLEKARYLKRVGIGTDRSVVFALVRKVTSAPRLREDGSHIVESRASDQMWRAMQMMDRFSKHDLATWASTDDKAVKVLTAGDYLKHLNKAGYLHLVQASKPGTAAVYRLKQVMKTGPLAPVIKRIKVVYDRNLKKIMWAEGVEHV